MRKIKIENENKDSNVINIPVILYLNIMRIISNILKLKASNCKDKKIIISIFSQNRELSSLNEDVADSIKQ